MVVKKKLTVNFVITRENKTSNKHTSGTRSMVVDISTEVKINGEKPERKSKNSNLTVS